MTRIGNDQLRALQELHGPSLLAYFSRRVQPPEDAAVLLNELLVVVWRKASSVPSQPEQARMWMFGIARNLVLTRQRGRTRRAALAGRLRDELAARPPETPSDVVITVRQAVASLPEVQRELVRLVHWDGFTLTEAATITGVSASTARSRYQLARRKLARELATVVDLDEGYPTIDVSFVAAQGDHGADLEDPGLPWLRLRSGSDKSGDTAATSNLHALGPLSAGAIGTNLHRFSIGRLESDPRKTVRNS